MRSIAGTLWQRRTRRRHVGTTLLAVPLCGLLIAACGGGSGEGSKTGVTTTTSTGTTTATETETATTTTTVTAVTGTAVSPETVRASSGGIAATLHAPTHKPRVNVPWHFSFNVTKEGEPTKAKVTYDYLFGGQVVEKRANYTFTGHFSDVSRWPASSVGYALTFRAVLSVDGKTFYLDYPIKVHK